MTLENLRQRRPHTGELTVVAGAGRSGLAATRLLVERGARVRLLEREPGTVPDETWEQLRNLGVDCVFGEHKPEHFEHAVFVVPSPGIPVARLAPLIAARDGVKPPEILAETELAWRYLEGEPVLAITGTSGKTTTASLAAAMLQTQGYSVFLGGNIGTPLSEYVLGKRRADVLVLEISSFQLQTCSTFRPRVGVLLNISSNHLDYHRDMREYIEAKFRLFRCQDEGDLAVLASELRTPAKAFHLKARQVYIENTNRFAGCRLLGEHNKLNMEAAWQACRFFGVSAANAESAVAAFHPLPHRLETVRLHRGITYINDSKCTTVAALRVALQAMDKPVRLLCGGKFKGGDLAGLRGLVGKHVAEVALFGASREKFEEAWQGTVPITRHEKLESAVRLLNDHAQRGDVVLLSPGTSSFDLYANYMERGNDFRRIVEALP
ncbi:MAG: UDP-N-acetylmuramoyl-L-alanine--D-glutamate ligase [Desulfovibrio sp.]|jgi:UDP-N-acetylmuramoylalanine--D-glutamate ligase|nr:UDP-N-acetylmuramoyl-L-alanine--D-glutamate ligase [Desulfovibrio sp.]